MAPSDTAASPSSARDFVWQEGRTFARAHWRMLARFVSASLCRTVTTVAVVLLIRDFLAGVLAEQQGLAAGLARSIGQGAALWVLAGLLLLTFITGSVLAYHTQVVMQRLVRLLELDLMQRLMRHLLTLPVSFFDRQRKGDLLDSVRQDVSRTRSAIAASMESATYGAQVAGYLLSVVMLSPRLALMSVPVLLIAAVPTRWISRQLQRRSFELRRHGYHLTDLLLQLLQGVRIVKIYAGEEAETRNSIGRARSYFAELVAQVRVRALGDVMLESIAGLSVVIVTVMGGFEVMRGRMSFPGLVAFLVAIRAMHGPLNNAFSQFLEVQKNWASVERVRSLLATEPEIRDRPDAVALTGPIETLRFDGVSFGYRGGPPILKDLSLEVKAGQRVGIVGPSGAGKTTLVSLIARFYDPTAGRVLLNGRDLREYRLADLYRHMAMVTQDPFVFGTSARDNIRYGCPDATDAESRGGRSCRRDPRRSRGASGGIRHRPRRGRPPAVGRAGAAPERGSRAAQERAAADARRGDVEPRLDFGGQSAGRPRAAHEGADDDCDRAPALDAAERGHHRRARRGPLGRPRLSREPAQGLPALS